jgi:hypothetical protein
MDLITGKPQELKSDYGQVWKTTQKDFRTIPAEVADKLKTPCLFRHDCAFAGVSRWCDSAMENRCIGVPNSFFVDTCSRKCSWTVDGLPMRTAIVEGSFVVREACLAGTAIVEAYRLCGCLDFSGTVLSPELGRGVLKQQKTPEPVFTERCFKRFIVEYLSPLKGRAGNERHPE